MSSKCSLSTFLLFVQDGVPGLSFTLESAFVLRNPGSFNGKWYLETKICMLPVLVATGVSLLPSLFNTRSLEKKRHKVCVCVHKNTHMFMSMSIF